MKTIKYDTQSPEVVSLTDMLSNLGYNVIVSDKFTLETEEAVKEFQSKNNLVIDGNVGEKTWSKLYEQCNQFAKFNYRFLSEQNLVDFASAFNLPLATVKAVNEVESSGKGFLQSGKPKILFEGHVFWKQLTNRGYDPKDFLNDSTKDVLYPKWTKNYYLGGDAEYNRLQKAIRINPSKDIEDAANASASWGCFQIMGFHALPLGYESISDFVEKMNLNEEEHLKAFGHFLNTNHLIPYLQNLNWSEFARRYNGSEYKVNKYDTKLANAYKKYIN